MTTDGPAPTPAAEADPWRLTACRSCGSDDLRLVLDLGRQPLANALVEPGDMASPQAAFPLELVVCGACTLCQVSQTVPPEILFDQDYPYFSSFIPALLAHSREHALDLIAERDLGPDDLVVEIASNDGYLLRNFVEEGIPVLGIDPAEGPAVAALAAGVPTVHAFFGAALARTLAEEGHRPSVMLGNNVLAHVADINDFVAGFAILLADDGIVEFEFPYVRELLERCAFDTIYHEHVFYYSLTALEPIFARAGLHLNDATPLDIHGGSLRLRVSRDPARTPRLAGLMADERRLGLDGVGCYADFGARVRALRDALRELLGDIAEGGGRIAAYGAAAKGATLLNYAGLPDGLIRYVVDRNVHKVGKAMPGELIPIRDVAELRADPPTHLLILPWNFADEIMEQQADFAAAGGRFLVAVPWPGEIGPGEIGAGPDSYRIPQPSPQQGASA